MPRGFEFEILPIEGREEAQKFAAKLPTKAEKFNTKKISLNERFGILEMGYYLHPSKIEHEEKKPTIRFTVKGKEVLTKEQFVQKQKALEVANNKKIQQKDEYEEEDKENATKPRSKKPAELEPSDKLTPEAYFNEIKHQLSQPLA